MSTLRNILNDPNRIRVSVTVRNNRQRPVPEPPDEMPENQSPRDSSDEIENDDELQQLIRDAQARADQAQAGNEHQFENQPQRENEHRFENQPQPENEHQFENLPQRENEHQFENLPEHDQENEDPWDDSFDEFSSDEYFSDEYFSDDHSEFEDQHQFENPPENGILQNDLPVNPHPELGRLFRKGKNT